MSLLLAPYNDSMRIGMGFNSYTQNLCIDNAVEIAESSLKTTDNPSQNVTYSSKFVTHLSEVVSSMQISHSSSIKKGTVEVAGNGDSINEDKIKSSDINAVISVKVVNQTIVSGDNAIYKPLQGIFPGTQQFNDNFGDCYISGFITGGEFNGVISMRVIDRSKTTSVVASIKKSSRAGKGADFTFDLDTTSSSFLNSSALNDTETTITVSWMGGGQIKDASTAWSPESVYAAADAFPARVARRPQRTWAILTKYKANRSFVYQTSKLSFSPLEYDLVAAFTSSLFDNYMDYKSMIKSLQDMMEHPDRYEAVITANALPLNVQTLVAVRSALRVEMNKIVQAVDILTKDPQILKRSGKLTTVSPVKTVQDIIAQSTSGVKAEDAAAFWDWQQSDDFVDDSSLTWPVQPEKSTASAIKTTATTGVATPPANRSQSYHKQWVWIDSKAVPEGSKAATRPPTTSTSRMPGLYRAWTETSARVRDLTQAPGDGFDEKQGSWKLIMIETFRGIASSEGSWEIGLVETSAEPAAATEKSGPSAQSGESIQAQAQAPAGTSGESQSSSNNQTDNAAEPAKAAETSTQTPSTRTRPPGRIFRVPATVNFDLLISPEIWKNVMPRAKDASYLPPGAEASKMPLSAAGGFPEAPKDDMDFTDRRSNKAIVKLEILAAVCGTLDFTDNLRELVKTDTTFVVDTAKIRDMLTTHDAQPDDLTEVFLAFVFQYTGQPQRLCVTNMLSIQQSLTLTPESTQYPVLKATPWQPDTWSLSAIVYAGKHFSSETAINDVLSKLKANYDMGRGQRQVAINAALLKEDPWKGFKKPSVIFYQARTGGQLRAAVGIDPDVPCLLTESLTSVSDAQVKAAQHSKMDLEGRDATVTRLQNEVTDTKSQLDRANADLQKKEEQHQEEIKAKRFVEDEVASKESARALAQREVADTKNRLAAKEAEANNLTSQLTTAQNLTKTWVRQNPARPGDNNLDASWNGKRVQLLNMAALETSLVQANIGMPPSYGGFAAIVTTDSPLVHGCMMFARLKMVDPSDRDAGWWLTTLNNSAIQMQGSKPVIKPFNENDSSQQWFIGLAPNSQFAVRIRTMQWGDCFIMHRAESNWQLEIQNPERIQPDKPFLYDFHITALD